MDEITNFEIENIVDNFKVSQIEEIGTRPWFVRNEAIAKLHFVALSEAMQAGELGREERVKNAVLHYGKLDAFIRELVTLSVWKKNLLGELLKLKPPPSNSFPCYIVLYQEILLVGILQSILFHEDSFNHIEDTANDLVDYAIYQLTQISQISEHLTAQEVRIGANNAVEEINREQNRINFIVGSQCVTLLRYVTDNLNKLPLSVATTIYTGHDLPVLAAQLVDLQTWTRRRDGKTFKFNENDWKEWRDDDPSLSKTECQVWLLLRQLILNPACSTTYNLTTYRREQLSKLLKYLHDDAIDQLSVLSDVKECLLRNINLASNELVTDRSALIVEINHRLTDVLSNKYAGKWRETAVKIAPLLLYPTMDDVKFLVESFGKCYESLADLNDKCNTCSYCMKKATKKCSKCRQTWYCTRECQIQHWVLHKKFCK